MGREIDLQDTERESSSQGNLQAFSHTASHIYIQLPPHRLHSNLLLRSIQDLHSSHTSKDMHAHSDHPEASTFSRPGDPNYRLSSSHVVTGHRKHVLPWEEVSNQTASFSTLGGDSASVRGALCRRLKRPFGRGDKQKQKPAFIWPTSGNIMLLHRLTFYLRDREGEGPQSL